MKRIYFLAVLAFVVMFSCQDEDVLQNECENETNQELIPENDIRKLIEKQVKESGDFYWKDVDPYVLWSAAMHGDAILTVGYSRVAYSEEKTNKQKQAQKEVLETVLAVERSNQQKQTLKSEDILVHEPKILNYVDVKITSLETVIALQSLDEIRYIEPNGFRYFTHEALQKSSSGCDKTVVPVASEDYETMAPGCQVSWTYLRHQIVQAWAHSTGQGITVGLIDTGISDDQSLLGSGFESGYSNNRNIIKKGVYVDSFWPWSNDTDGYHDKCGHGTLMGATIAGPRNNRNLPTGVAYNCNLVAYRAVKNVVVDGYHEKRGVSRALTELGNRSDVRVISMSIGHVFSIGNVRDAVEYAYSKGKMIIAAGGTSTTFTNWAGVIFPASMNETVAVTGIKDMAGYTECDVCHKGDKIDFTVIMQRANNDHKSVSLGYYDNTRTYVGGSSVATATTAGIAALIWGKNPGWSRAQVLQRMKESASLYPYRDDDFGWGSINVLAAVQ